MDNVVVFESRVNKTKRIEKETLEVKISKMQTNLFHIEEVIEKLKSVEGLPECKLYVIKE